MTVATFSLVCEAAEEQSVVSRAQLGEMSHGGAPCDTPVQHGFHDRGFEHPYSEPERCRGRSYGDRPYPLRRTLAVALSLIHI